MTIEAVTRRRLLAAATALPLAAAAPGPAGGIVVARIHLEEGRVWVAVTLDGHGPYPFALDTGAQVSGVEVELARRLHLRRVGAAPVGGVGGLRVLPLYAVREAVLGGAIRQPDMGLFGFDARLLGGVAGLLAAGVITSLDSDLDFAAGEWRVYPRGRGDRPDFTRLTSEFQHPRGVGSTRLVITAVLDGREGRFLLDTGMPGEVALRPAAVRRRALWDAPGPYAPARPRGVGGASRPARIRRLRELEIGPARFAGPLVTLLDPDDPSDRTIEDPTVDGLLGLQVLARLDLGTDVAREAVWVRPNGSPPEPETYNRSGVSIERQTDGRLFVTDVGTGSPAAAAGLQPGDRLVGVGDFEALRQALAGAAGGTVELAVERGGGVARVRLTLADYL